MFSILRSTDSTPHILPCILAFLLPSSLTVWVVHFILTLGNNESYLSLLRCVMSILVPSLLLHHAIRSKKLDKMAAVVAFGLGFVETLCNSCMIATSIMFFLAGTGATKLRQKSGRLYDEDDHKTKGRRNWIQVISNGGVGLEIAILLLIERGPANEMPINFQYDYFPSWLSIAFLGSIACACGDTLASELTPVLSSSEPRLIINPFKRVPKGTNGGVTVAGLACSLLGGLICGITYFVVTLLSVNRDLLDRSPPQWPLVLVGGATGWLGSLLDSVIGATMQYSGIHKASGRIVSKSGTGIEPICGSEILDNHSVNLVSTLLTALIAPHLGRIIWANV